MILIKPQQDKEDDINIHSPITGLLQEKECATYVNIHH